MSAERTSAARLLDELVGARTAFLAALDDVEPALRTAPGLVGDWSARELVAHLGYWTGHAAEATHRAEQGTLADFGADDPDFDIDAINATVARVGRETDLATVRQREQAAYDALVERLGALDDAWLTATTGYRDSLEQVLREDGPEHYREHTIDLRAWFDGTDVDEDDDDAAADADEPDADEPDADEPDAEPDGG